MLKTELVWKTDFFVDLLRLSTEAFELVNRIGFQNATNQIGLTHTPDCPEEERFYESVGSLYDYDKDIFVRQERDFSVFNKKLQGTYLEWIYHNVPFRVARMRLMRIQPKRCLSIHDDTGPRFHIAIKTNRSSFLFFPDHDTSVHIPFDGYLYGIKATEMHTALNADSKEERIHLVFSDFENS